MQASMRTLIRAVGLYLGYYLGFSVGVPLMLAFDAWSIVPLWACMLIAALAEFVHAVWVVGGTRRTAPSIHVRRTCRVLPKRMYV